MTNQLPELEKMRLVRDKSQAIGDFLEWFLKKYDVAKWNEHGTILEPVGFINIEKLLAEYFEIDLNKVEQENRMILEDLRKKG